MPVKLKTFAHVYAYMNALSAETIIIMQLTPRLQMALSGIKREQATTRNRCTITKDLMLQINTILSQ